MYHKKKDIRKGIEYALNLNCQVAASSTNVDMNQVIPKGTPTAQAYEVLELKEIHYEGKTVKLVKLCNPWDEQEWEGEWGMTWSGWTQALRD